jgi:hypothetical protein
MGCEITRVYKDHGISGAKGRDKRPAFDAMCRDANRRQFDDRRERSHERDEAGHADGDGEGLSAMNSLG